MANLRTIDFLLDRLMSADDAFWAPRPAAPVTRAAAAPRVARDGSQTELPPTGLRKDGGAAEASGRPVADARSAAQPIGQGTANAQQANAAADPRPVVGHASAAVQGSDAQTPLAPGGSRSPILQTPSASLELSPTAQWLRSLLPAGTAPARAPSIRVTEPLLDAPPKDAQGLAQALRSSIAQSGLFYESHLADWVVQRYPEALLRREPQAAWNDGAAAHADAPTEAAAGPASTVAPLHVLDDGHLTTVDLMRAQLQALESRQLSWQGELWPGQHASLTITDEGASGGDAYAPAWRTQVTLHLPELGRVDVELRLSGGALVLDVAAPSLRSVELLREAGADLVSSLEAHTLGGASVGIRQS